MMANYHCLLYFLAIAHCVKISSSGGDPIRALKTSTDSNPANDVRGGSKGGGVSSKLKCPSANDDIVFEVFPQGDFIEGQANKLGERIIWSVDPLKDLDGNEAGNDSGICTAIAEDSGDGYVSYLCSLLYEFVTGPLAGPTGSKLLVTGIFRYASATDGSDKGLGDYTIAGGTGCFSGASGSVVDELVSPTSPVVYRETVKLETAKHNNKKCPTKGKPVVYQDVAVSDFFEGSSYGDRLAWFQDPLKEIDSGRQVGTDTGHCTVIAEADENGMAQRLCTIYVAWTAGDLAGSTLLPQGVLSSDASSGIGNMTITGGTGCFAGASGVFVDEMLSPTLFKETIVLE